MRTKSKPTDRGTRAFGRRTDPMRPILADDALYLGDNGAIYCGIHAATSARFTGRDISGQKVERIGAFDARAWRVETGRVPECETCGIQWMDLDASGQPTTRPSERGRRP